jgi:hypothetical protein
MCYLILDSLFGKLIRNGKEERVFQIVTRYEGEFSYGWAIYGHGTMFYADGSVYKGKFLFNERRGQGTLIGTKGTML